MAYYEDKERSERRARRARNLDLSSIGLVFPVAALIGYWAGSHVGSWFDAERAGGLVGLAFGIVSGFYNVYKVILRLNRIQDEEDRLAAERRSGAAGGEGGDPA